MDESDPKKEAVPSIVIMDRRTRRSELTSAEVMKILRKRAAKALRRGSGGSGNPNGASG